MCCYCNELQFQRHSDPMLTTSVCPADEALVSCAQRHFKRVRSFKCVYSAVAGRECSLYSQLIRCVDGQSFGASSTQQQREQILQVVQQLKLPQPPAASSAVQPALTAGPLDGNWRLLWTTEAAVHNLVQGQLLGVPVSDILQQVDLREERVINTIAFGLLGLQLQASGPLTVLNSTRIYYSFDKLVLGLLGFSLTLPLFIKGGGWTDCVAMQQDVRVMENSRRDTLVLQRVP